MNKEWQHLIEQYLQYKLTDDEATQFEHLLRNEPQFVEQLRLMKSISMNIHKVNEQAFMSQLQASAGTRRINIIALSAVAAALLFFVYLGMQPQYSMDDLFDEYYTTLPYNASRSGLYPELIDNHADTIRMAEENYKAKNYAKAVGFFEYVIEVNASRRLSDGIYLYAATSEIETGNYEQAIKNLNYLIDGAGKDPKIIDTAKWYLALIYVQQNQREKAIALLEQLQDTDTQAKALFKKLKAKR